MVDTKTDPVKIASLELENIKRIKAVSITPTTDGLTVIGGRNAQGKTSVLDAIAWALGGNSFKPQNPTREGSATPAKLKIELSNGLIVTRQGSSGTLKVVDPTGKKSGQTLLNSFIEQLALNLPKFMNSTDKEKAEVLLDLIGVKDQIKVLDNQIETLSDQRRPLKTDYLGKRKVAADMPYYADAPEEPVSATELIEKQQAILAKNSQNQTIRQKVVDLEAQMKLKEQQEDDARERVKQIERDLVAANNQVSAIVNEKFQLFNSLSSTKDIAQKLVDESTEDIEQKLRDIDAINEKVRANQRRADLEAEAETTEETYKAISDQIETVRKQRIALLEGANMPLDDLDVKDGYLVYKGITWSDMSSAEQLRVATAIVRALKPDCGFVLVDKLEQMDTQTLADFGSWAQSVGLQVIGTRVSTGDECSVVIEDGYAKQDTPAGTTNTQDVVAPVTQPMSTPVSTAAQEPISQAPQAPFMPGVF
ncbi:AAA family ATPase [Atopobium minutum]|uniref:AAA family ATPase n=1 Tax=Atopobium minutum TaxID=1381 RepID=UPI001DB64F3C|nr:AAA family ATPase [Atopobium minutum]MBS4874218.1 AAA family ATPase [Atopobium minutum]MDU5129701.1 AAA family ATPase [Atopobium minutum]